MVQLQQVQQIWKTNRPVNVVPQDMQALLNRMK